VTGTSVSLKGALLVDFTRTVKNFKHLKSFGDKFVSLIRDGNSQRCVVIIDRAVGRSPAEVMVVRDHINLMGTTPLLGPNHPLGDRFPVVQGIYVVDELSSFPQVVAAGLKDGIKPSDKDIATMKEFGADVCCYNLVPSMLIAAHAHCRVLGIILAESAKLPEDAWLEIQRLTGEGK
jgi:hypothetical protein